MPRIRECFDSGWRFHYGELGRFPKTVKKSGLIAGLTNSLQEEQLEPFASGPLTKFFESMAGGSSLADSPLQLFMDSTVPNDKFTGWRHVDLPHDWRIEQEFCSDIGLASQGYLPNGVGYYRKVFKIPKDDEGGKVIIEFDGVMRNSSVWLNGCFLGDHYSGYTSFHYDITDLLKYGEDEGDNVILVKTDTTGGDEGWWYEGGGIYRHVFLSKYSHLHVDHWGTFLYSKEIKNENACVEMQTTVYNEFSKTVDYDLKTMILDPDGNTVGTSSDLRTLNALEKFTYKNEFNVSNPHLWSVESPILYKAVTELLIDGRVVDQYITTFGIRTVEYKASGFYLNGKRIVIKGTCNHQDFAGIGVALPDSVQEYKIKKLQELGCNAYRCSHHQATPEFLDMCDRLGMLVMEENRVIESTENKLQDLETLIYRDRNHPSIFMWSLGNEEYISGSYQAKRMLRRLSETAHKLDPSRPITCAEIFVPNFDSEYFDILDVVGLNYAESALAEMSSVGIGKIHEKFSDQKFVNTENVSFFTTRGVYEDDAAKAHCSNFGSKFSMYGGEIGIGVGGTSTPENSWNAYRKNQFSGGIFVWTGFDYRGEPTPFMQTGVSSQYGIMDTCGFPKDYYYYYQSIWKEEPIVHIMPHWTWPGKEGQNIKIRIFTNCEEVELQLNGGSIGRKKKTGDWLEWDTVYQPGKLVAIGINKGTVSATDMQETAGDPHQICFELNKTKISKDFEVAFVTVTLRDAMGRVVPTADNLIKFDINGAGRLLGVGNGDPGSREPDYAAARHLFNGYCLALVQSNGTSGKITLTASSEQLVSCEVTIEAE